MRRIILTGLGLTALALAGCGGGGGGTHSVPAVPNATGTTPPQSAQRATASVTITIPAKTTSTDTRSPQYISASTQSMTFSLLDPTTGNTSPLASFDLTPSSPGCSAVASGGTQCTETLGAPSGTDTFQVTAYDQTGGKGNVLSSATVQAQLTGGQTNTIPLVMNGVAATTQVVVGTGTLPVGSNGTTTVSIQAKDAQGNTIVGPGSFSKPIALTIAADTWSTLSLSAAQISKPGESVTLSYNGNSLTGATITASANGVATTPATVAGSGYNVTAFSGPDYGNWNCGTSSSPVYGYGNVTPYSLAPFQNAQLAAEVYLNVSCGGNGRHQDGLAVVSPSGATTAYFGDTVDPTATPTPTPAPGTTPAPPPGVIVVHGMSTNVQEEPNDGYSTIATLGAKIFYSAAYAKQTTINGNPATVYNKGIIGVLDTTTNTTKEVLLNSGAPGAIRVAPNGTAFFVENSAYYCYNGPPFGCNSLTTDGSGNVVYQVGAIDASGTLLFERSFDSVGIPSTSRPYPADMTLAADGSAMYIAETGSYNRIVKLPISGTTIGSASFASLGPAYPYAIAAAPDNVLTYSGYQPTNNYYFSYVPTANFADTGVVTQPFTAQTYASSYSVAFGDGSYWAADNNNGGVARVSSVGNGTRLDYIRPPNASSNNHYLCGVAVAAGAVWGADCDYGGFVRIAYGAPSQNGIVGQAAVRSTNSVRGIRDTQRAQRHPHAPTNQPLAPLPDPNPVF